MNRQYSWQTSYMAAVIEIDDSQRVRRSKEARGQCGRERAS
jgi:hypothetical protein